MSTRTKTNAMKAAGRASEAAAAEPDSDNKTGETFSMKRQKLQLEKLELEIQLTKAAIAELLRESAVDESSAFFFTKAVTGTAVSEFSVEVNQWSLRHPNAPITIVFNTPGGNVNHGFALFDFITFLRLSGHHVTIIVLGMAASMGAVLLQAADMRLMGANAYLMIHEVSSGSWGKVSEMEEELKDVKDVQNRILKILSKNSTLSVAELRALWHKKDVWLDASQALAMKFVDGVMKTIPRRAEQPNAEKPKNPGGKFKL